MLLYEVLRICFLAVLISALAIRIEMSFSEKDAKKRRTHSPIFYPIYAPITIVVMLALSGVIMKFDPNAISLDQIMIYLLNVMVSLSLYLVVLILVSPKLSKKINPMFLSMLWVLPNLNYVLTWNVWYVKPDIVLKIPAWLLEHLDVIFIVWFAGFASMMIWKTVEHFVFRSNLLKSSEWINDDHILDIWKKEKQDFFNKLPEPVLVRSDLISSPLTIGLFPSTSFIILPNREYTDEQLMLIFRHELTHISRYDALTKLFVWFCIALNWFNPLVYTAMKRCSSHLEMCCDELVIYQENVDVRKEYADLILSESCDERGFTTCLSASAKAMKQRLIHVMEHQKKSGIAALILMSVFVLFLHTGIVFASSSDQGRQLLLETGIRQEDFVRVKISAKKYNASSTEESKKEALKDYLHQLELIEVKAGFFDDGFAGADIEIIYRNSSRQQKTIQLMDCKQGMFVMWQDTLYLCEGESVEKIASIYRKD